MVSFKQVAFTFCIIGTMQAQAGVAPNTAFIAETPCSEDQVHVAPNTVEAPCSEDQVHVAPNTAETPCSEDIAPESPNAINSENTPCPEEEPAMNGNVPIFPTPCPSLMDGAPAAGGPSAGGPSAGGPSAGSNSSTGLTPEVGSKSGEQFSHPKEDDLLDLNNANSAEVADGSGSSSASAMVPSMLLALTSLVLSFSL